MLYNYKKTRDRIYLDGLGVIKWVESGNLSRIFKSGVEVAEACTFLNQLPPRLNKGSELKYKLIVSGPGVHP